MKRLSLPDLRCTEEMPQDGDWPEGYLHLYRDGISTRAVEVLREAATFQVRVMTMSSQEDWELATRLVEAFAAISGTSIETEEGERFTQATLPEKFNADYFRTASLRGADTVAHVVRLKQKVVELPGPIRSFHLGPRLLAELDSKGPAAELPERIIRYARYVQFNPFNDYCHASVMVVKDRATDEESTMAVRGVGGDYLFPPVQFVVVSSSRQEMIVVPYETVPTIAEGRCSWLDERQLVVPAVTVERWPALVERARPHMVPRLSTPASDHPQAGDRPARTKKAWWKFWGN